MIHEKILKVLEKTYPEYIEKYGKPNSRVIKTGINWDDDYNLYISHEVGFGEPLTNLGIKLKTLYGQCSTVVLSNISIMDLFSEAMPEIEEILGEKYSLLMCTAKKTQLNYKYTETFDIVETVKNKRTSQTIHFLTKKI